MATLCIDTATEDGMIVVASDEGSTAEVRWRSAGRHAENLFGYIDTVLSQIRASRDDLSLVGAVIGPGRFTSVRVGLATAKGIALGLGLPIVGVSSLRVLARSIPTGDVRLPLMNAYRGDVFAAAYVLDGDSFDELVPPSFGDPRDVLKRLRDSIGDRPIAVRGDAVAANRDLIESLLGASVDDAAVSSSREPAALLAEVLSVRDAEGPADLAMLEPQYLRPSDAKLPDR